MFEVAVDREPFDAILLSRKRHVTLIRHVGAPEVADAIRIVEAVGGHKTGRACFARVLHVEIATADVTVLSIEVRMSTDRLPAVGG
jgi:hypothetical protein